MKSFTAASSIALGTPRDSICSGFIIDAKTFLSGTISLSALVAGEFLYIFFSSQKLFFNLKFCRFISIVIKFKGET